jgi:hypothetical protein
MPLPPTPITTPVDSVKTLSEALLTPRRLVPSKPRRSTVMPFLLLSLGDHSERSPADYDVVSRHDLGLCVKRLIDAK